MQGTLSILVVALLVEAIWENLKMVWQSGKINVDMIGALIVSILVAVLTKINVFSALGIPVSELFGNILTGVLISRGANFFHDLLAKVNQLNTNTKEGK